MRDECFLELREGNELSGLKKERIEPTFDNKKRKISLFFIFTFSVAIFFMGFGFADLASDISRKGIDALPSIILADYMGEDEEQIKLSEMFLGKMLGVTKRKAENFKYTEKDEPQFPYADSEETNIPAFETEKDDEPTPPDEEKEEGTKYPIVSLDLSLGELGEEYIMNETGYSPDIKRLISEGAAIPAFSEINKGALAPLVLIIHTHGTEAYSPEGKDYYLDDGGEIARSSDPEKNVISVGRVIADTLNQNGVRTIHCDIMHDKESYQDSYIRSAETIKSFLAKYPSIKYVFDVHRDAIVRSDSSFVRAVTKIDGEDVAQVMSVVGSNYKGANFPGWEDNLSFALALRGALNEKYENLCRPVYLRGAAYNQHYSESAILLEIGSSGNSLEEAKRAGALVGKSLAEIIKGRN